MALESDYREIDLGRDFEIKEAKRVMRKFTEWWRDWSDEIPAEIIHTGKYKVRIGWWSGIFGELGLALDNNLIKDSGVKSRCEQFLGKYCGTDYWNFNTARTKKEDIDEANSILQLVINTLSRSYPESVETTSV